MIRQAISCDICGTEKKQTNHWFIASEHAGELRITGWNVRNQRRGDTKHLCGQTCLHKLLDEFVAGSIGARSAAVAMTEELPAVVDRSLTSTAVRPFTPVVIPTRRESETIPEAKPVIVSPVTVVPLPMRQTDMGAPLVFSPRRSRAEAWERERERTQGHGDQVRPRKCF